MNPLPTPVRRNATRQDIQHIADMLAGLDIEADGAAQILESVDGALENSFYAAISHNPLLVVAKDMRQLVVSFHRPPAFLSQEMKADAANFAACTRLDRHSLEQAEPAL